MKILFIDDDPKSLLSLKEYFAPFSYQLSFASNLTDGQSLIRNEIYDLVISDLNMPDKSGLMQDDAGLRILETVQFVSPKTPVIIITAFGEISVAVEAMKLGATDFLEKPFTFSQLEAKINQISDFKQGDYSQPFEITDQYKDFMFHKMVGRSHLMLQLYKKIKLFAGQTDDILITGSTGTGKELVARALYECSENKKSPFVAINCGALPGSLIESELFGYEKGAFTGAQTNQIGQFEKAAKGFIFLDEIGELPIEFQAKLLRVIQFKTIQKIGGRKDIPIECRIIAATNKNLHSEIEQGNFRKDLYFRLNSFHIELNDLKDRIEDLDILIAFFVKKYNKVYQKNIRRIQGNVFRIFNNYSWPGNIRELENIMKYCISTSNSDMIQFENLPAEFVQQISHPEHEEENQFSQIESSAHEQKSKNMLIRALESSQGDVQIASFKLGMSDKTLYRKCKKYGISIKSFRYKNESN